jgi:hypothetical protein
VHPPRNYDARLVDLERSLTAFLENTLDCRLTLRAEIPPVGDGEQVHLPGLAGAAEDLTVEVYFLVLVVLLREGVDKVLAVLVGVGVGEGELDPVLLVEGEAEGELGLVRRVVLRGGAGTYSLTSWRTFSKGRWLFLRATGW